MKRTIDFCKKKTVCSNRLDFFIIIFDVPVSMKIRISSAYATRMKVLIFADLRNYCIVIVENTKAQYFDNLSEICMGVYSPMTMHSCIKFANIQNVNALFLATYAELILVFVRNKEIANTCNLQFVWVLFATIYSKTLMARTSLGPLKIYSRHG